jgi:hypothetical protein
MAQDTHGLCTVPARKCICWKSWVYLNQKKGTKNVISRIQPLNSWKVKVVWKPQAWELSSGHFNKLLSQRLYKKHSNLKLPWPNTNWNFPPQTSDHIEHCSKFLTFNNEVSYQLTHGIQFSIQIQIEIKGVEELKRSFNFNASEVIPQPCISSVTGGSHAVCWSMC